MKAAAPPHLGQGIRHLVAEVAAVAAHVTESDGTPDAEPRHPQTVDEDHVAVGADRAGDEAHGVRLVGSHDHRRGS